MHNSTVYAPRTTRTPTQFIGGPVLRGNCEELSGLGRRLRRIWSSNSARGLRQATQQCRSAAIDLGERPDLCRAIS